MIIIGIIIAILSLMCALFAQDYSGNYPQFTRRAESLEPIWACGFSLGLLFIIAGILVLALKPILVWMWQNPVA